jgi:hypothetical protein
VDTEYNIIGSYIHSRRTENLQSLAAVCTVRLHKQRSADSINLLLLNDGSNTFFRTTDDLVAKIQNKNKLHDI